MVWTRCSLAALAVLLAVLIVCLQVEVEMAGHGRYGYWDASCPSRSFDSTLTTITGTGIFQDQAHNFQDSSSLSWWVLNESSIAIRCRTTLQWRSVEYADLHPGSADIVIVLVFSLQIWTDHVLLQGASWIFPNIGYPATGSRSWILLRPTLNFKWIWNLQYTAWEWD